jgi:tRNA U34 2-thiouridine synthase MnmA/TrmU
MLIEKLIVKAKDVPLGTVVTKLTGTCPYTITDRVVLKINGVEKVVVPPSDSVRYLFYVGKGENSPQEAHYSAISAATLLAIDVQGNTPEEQMDFIAELSASDSPSDIGISFKKER